MARNILAGNAQPVAIVGSENADGSSASVLTVAVDTVGTLEFTPSGAHSDGTSISSAVTLTPPAGATKLLIQALGQNVRFRLDGTNPTASAGFQLKAGDPATIIPVASGGTVRVIEEAATADLQYQWGS